MKSNDGRHVHIRQWPLFICSKEEVDKEIGYFQNIGDEFLSSENYDGVSPIYGEIGAIGGFRIVIKNKYMIIRENK
jgi:hypothetical protein